MIGKVNIDVSFNQLSSTMVERSSKGECLLIIRDDTDKTFTAKSYTDVLQLTNDKNKFSETNYKSLLDCFLGNPLKVTVIRLDLADEIADALTIAQSMSFNYVCLCDSSTADQAVLVTWIKSQNIARTKRIKLITYKALVTNDIHIINFVNESVRRKGEAEDITGEKYLGRLVGIFAGLSFDRSATFYILDDLEYVKEPVDVTVAINGGGLVLVNDETVKIARAINSLTTVAAGQTDDWKFIAIVEVMDLIIEDVKNTFKNTFIGIKNGLSNQILFLTSVEKYFKNLAKIEVLDSNYNNSAEVDVNAMRSAWSDRGRDLSELSDEDVMKMTIGTDVYAIGDVKPLNAIEGLNFPITMV